MTGTEAGVDPAEEVGGTDDSDLEFGSRLVGRGPGTDFEIKGLVIASCGAGAGTMVDETVAVT